MNASNFTDHMLHPCLGSSAPFSGDFFMNISTVTMVLIVVCACVVVLTVVNYLEQFHYILNHYQTNKLVKYRTLEILAIYPTVSLTSMIALCIPRASIPCHLANAIYISMCLYKYTTLMVLYFGGKERIIWQLKGEMIATREPPCCCCCFCLPNLAVTVRNVRLMKTLVLQNAILQPLITFVTLVLWTDERYIQGKLSQDNAFLYLNVITVISSMFALYGLNVVFKLCKGHLKPVYLVPKFVALQLVILFCHLQDGVFSILARFHLPVCMGIFSPEVRGQEFFHMMLVFEMFLLSLLARWLYRRPHDVLSNLPLHQKETATSGNYTMDKIESPPSANAVQIVTSIDSHT